MNGLKPVTDQSLLDVLNRDGAPAPSLPSPGMPPAPPGSDSAMGGLRPVTDKSVLDLLNRDEVAPAQNAAPPAQPQQRGGLVDGVVAFGHQLMDALNAGSQRTTPIVRAMDGKDNYALAPQEDQALYDETGQLRDARSQVVLRNPDTGKMAVYLRGSDTNESGAAGIGRVLAFGASVAPIARAASVPVEVAASPARQLVDDFARVGVDPSLPAVAQNRTVSGMAATAREVPVAGNVIQKGAERMIEQTAQSADRIASGYGDAGTPLQAGRSAKQGVEKFVKGEAPGVSDEEAIRLPTKATSFARKSEALFNNVGIPGDAEVQMNGTRGALQGIAGRFQSNPELGDTLVPQQFKTWLDKLGNGTLTWDEAKEFRSFVGRKIATPALVNDIPRADLKSLYAGLSEDLQAAANSAGKGREFKMANAYYSAGMDRVNNALNDIFRADSPEAAYTKILQAAQARGSKADVGKMMALRRSIPDEQWGDVASTVIRQMGRPTPGASDPLSVENFSPNRFVTEYAKLSDEAKGVLFNGTGNSDLRGALDALVRVMGAQKNVEKLYNGSGTGRVGMAGAVGAGAATDLGTTLGLIGATTAGSALLMSPKFVQWMTALPAMKTPKAAAAHMARLSAIAEQEPALAEPIRQLHYGFAGGEANPGDTPQQ